jgi:hypothetical protein
MQIGDGKDKVGEIKAHIESDEFLSAFRGEGGRGHTGHILEFDRFSGVTYEACPTKRMLNFVSTKERRIHTQGEKIHRGVAVSPSAKIATWRNWFRLSRDVYGGKRSFPSYTKTKTVESTV